MPDGSGLEILAHLQEHSQSIPVICLTGRKDLASKASAFSLGAEDFIEKPFNPLELKMRVNARIRKYSEKKNFSQELEIGELRLSSAEQTVLTKSGKNISLTTHEFKILNMFANAPKRIFTRDEIIHRVWRDSVSVNDRAVDVHISNVRRKISGSKVFIKAVIGRGYKLEIDAIC